ncbi:hypothetical protein LTR24_008988 [Lithohypha guttulata]|uniref:Uncharacterized protein n=1 Tax=Lithohypha guttulata TaxID=1690604 RepID=A0ABR0JYD2_9EURO|nr:hypothetical protein LTR24_008988 [Lithohypha guttulata]
MATLEVTLSTIMDERGWDIETFSYNGRMDSLALSYAEDSPKVTVVGRFPDGIEVPCTIKIPILKLMIMSPAIDDSVKASGLLPGEINELVIDVESLDALALISGVIIKPECYLAKNGLVCVRRIDPIDTQPFSTYLQVAKLAQALVMRPIWDDMVGRLTRILYQGDKLPWGAQISDLAALLFVPPT